MVRFEAIATLEDAKAWLAAQESVSRERLQMLILRFISEPDVAGLLHSVLREHDVALTGEEGM